MPSPLESGTKCPKSFVAQTGCQTPHMLLERCTSPAYSLDGASLFHCQRRSRFPHWLLQIVSPFLFLLPVFLSTSLVPVSVSVSPSGEGESWTRWILWKFLALKCSLENAFFFLSLGFPGPQVHKFGWITDFGLYHKITNRLCEIALVLYLNILFLHSFLTSLVNVFDRHSWIGTLTYFISVF